MQAPKRMASGAYVDLANFQVEDVNIEDINQSLNTIFRFTGHWKDKKPLTVAQHTWLCIVIADRMFPNEPEVAFDCLLHDMPEAYYGDVATPWKQIVGQPLRDAQKEIDKAVYEALWTYPVSFTEEVESKRKICDLISLDIERRNIWKSQLGKDLWPDIPTIGLNMSEKEDLFDEAQSFSMVDLIELYSSIVNDGRQYYGTG